MSQEKVYKWEQCLEHINKQSCWVIINQNVYDVTPFIGQHPGGQQKLLKYSGSNATRKFQQIGHSQYAKSIMRTKSIGKIQASIPSLQYQKRLNQKKAQKNKNQMSTIEVGFEDQNNQTFKNDKPLDSSNRKIQREKQDQTQQKNKTQEKNQTQQQSKCFFKKWILPIIPIFLVGLTVYYLKDKGGKELVNAAQNITK